VIFFIISPNSVEDILIEIMNRKDDGFRLGAGFTDLLMEFKKQKVAPVTVINLAKNKGSEFINFDKEQEWSIGEIKLCLLMNI